MYFSFVRVIMFITNRLYAYFCIYLSDCYQTIIIKLMEGKNPNTLE